MNSAKYHLGHVHPELDRATASWAQKAFRHCFDIPVSSDDKLDIKPYSAAFWTNPTTLNAKLCTAVLSLESKPGKHCLGLLLELPSEALESFEFAAHSVYEVFRNEFYQMEYPWALKPDAGEFPNGSSCCDRSGSSEGRQSIEGFRGCSRAVLCNTAADPQKGPAQVAFRPLSLSLPSPRPGLTSLRQFGSIQASPSLMVMATLEIAP